MEGGAVVLLEGYLELEVETGREAEEGERSKSKRVYLRLSTD